MSSLAAVCAEGTGARTAPGALCAGGSTGLPQAGLAVRLHRKAALIGI